MLPSTSFRASAGSFSIVLIALSCRFYSALLQGTPLTAARNVSGINGNRNKEAGVGKKEEEKKDRIYHKDANRWARAR